MKLHLIRHPPPDIAPGICYGQLDIPAFAVDTTAADLLPRLPQSIPLWSSPLQRCRALADRLGTLRQQVIHTDPRLMEIHFGDWEGQPWDAIPRAALDAWATAPLDHTPPGGESARALLARARAFLHAQSEPELILITHGGVIRALRAHMLQLPDTDWLQGPIAFGSLTTVEGPL